jgi:rhomboid family GlyGly-CTERM serine protease
MGLSQRSHDARKRIFAALPALAVIILAGALVLAGDTAREVLRFDRAGLADGQAWRVITGHFVHLGPGHFLLNAAGVALVALLVAGEFRVLEWAAFSIAVIAGIGAGLWFFNPELAWYVGLSGLLHGWLAAGIVGLLDNRRPDGWPLAVLVGGKLAIEQWMGPLPGSAEASGGPVVVDAHLYGAIAGAAAALLATRLGRSRGL